MKRSLLGALRGRSAAATGSVGVWIEPAGVAVARVSRESGVAQLDSCIYRPTMPGSDNAYALRGVMSNLGPDAGRCNYVLSPSQYQTLLVDTPDVPPSEMREAVRWKIHDMVDIPLNDLTIDVFDVPLQISHGEEGARSLCVVVTRSSLIEQQSALLTRCGCQLSAIDITELALRNLMAQSEHDREGRVVLHQEGDYSLIVITKGATVYLSRRIEIGHEHVARAARDGSTSETFTKLMDAITEELYRSMEYCESRFDGLAPAAISLTPTLAQSHGIEQGLASLSSLPVETLSLDRLIKGRVPDLGQHHAAGMLAVGAALRQEQTTL